MRINPAGIALGVPHQPPVFHHGSVSDAFRLPCLHGCSLRHGGARRHRLGDHRAGKEVEFVPLRQTEELVRLPARSDVQINLVPRGRLSHRRINQMLYAQFVELVCQHLVRGKLLLDPANLAARRADLYKAARTFQNHQLFAVADLAGTV